MSRIMQNNTNSIMDKRNVTSANTKRELLQNRLSNRSSETHRIELEVPRSKWNILSEVINCQLGRNLLPQRRFFGSLQGVRQLELKYNLTDNEMYEVRSLNFNKKGNLLVNTSYNKILIWNWTARERALLTCVKGGEAEYIFRIKWFDTNSLVLSNFRGEIFLVHVKRNVLERLTMFNVRSRFTVVHDETPHVILCATRRAKVFSIDIRQKEIHKLFIVKEGPLTVPLTHIDSNPFNSNEFCVSGVTYYVRVYDRRNVVRPVLQLFPHNMDEYNEYSCCLYNYNGTEILATYKKNIYLFDILKSSNTREVHKYKNYFNNVCVYRLIAEEGVKFFGPKSEYVVSGSESGNIFIWEKNMGTLVNYIKSNGIHVNCLEGHPHLPVLATQHSHRHIGIWQPF